MKSRKLISTFLGLAMTTSIFAQSTATQQTNVSTSSIANTWQAIKDGPLSASFSIDTSSSVGSSSEIGNLGILNFGYQFNDTDRLSVTNIFQYAFDPDLQGDNVTTNRHERIHFSYSKSGLIDEKTYGFNATATAELRLRPDADYRESANRYGMTRFGARFTKTIGDLYLSVHPRVAKYITKSDTFLNSRGEQRFTNNYYLYLVMVQSYTVLEDLSLTLSEEVLQITNKNSDASNYVTLTAEVSKPIMTDVSLSGYLTNDIIVDGTGGWARNETFTKDFTVGLNLGLSIF